MPGSDTRALKSVRSVAEREGLNWELLTTSAEQLILFGSAAAGLANRNSDFDILCVGEGRRFKSRRLDIKWVSQETLLSRRWLTSELATHIAKYGRWLYGVDNWSRKAKVTSHTIAFKRKLIIGRAERMQTAWPFLSAAYRAKHATKLRREFQRLQLLNQREAVIPTPLLDFLWSRETAKNRFLTDMVKHARLPVRLHLKEFESLMISTIYLKPVSAGLDKKLRVAWKRKG